MRVTDRPYTIYAIQCVETGRVYVGSTSNLQQRIKSHFAELRQGRKTDSIPGAKSKPYRRPSIWQEDFKAYGADSFKVFAIEENVEPENQAVRESHYIDYYDSTNPDFGYNKRPGMKKPVEVIKGMPERKANTNK